LWIRVRIDFGRLEPDPDPEGKMTHKNRSEEISCFEVFDVHFWGLKTSLVAWTSFLEKSPNVLNYLLDH
jgi:hypothetical protein